MQRLHGIADLFLVHNRPIVRHVDDSIVRILLGRELLLRRARGYAPLPISIQTEHHSPILAVGAHLKNTVALSVGTNIFVSQHIGDLETHESLHAFRRVIEDFKRLFDVKPAHVVCDLHPDYLSTQFAKALPLPITAIQHHYAHVAACMAENQLEGELLGVSWDGTGLGLDGTIWGGEFLLTSGSSFERVASFQTFPLPGGELAIKEPRRVALGLLHEMFGSAALQRQDIASFVSFTGGERRLIGQAIEKNINCPRTSSVGRLFDGVASLVGLRQVLAFEGQAAMELEFAAANNMADERYDFELLKSAAAIVINWTPIIEGILADVRKGIPVSLISSKFHNTLAQTILGVARETDQSRVVLTGGCFQNKYLTEQAVNLLTQHGIRPYWHQRIPPNDGGIALGQIYALERMAKKTHDKPQEAEVIG